LCRLSPTLPAECPRFSDLHNTSLAENLIPLFGRSFRRVAGGWRRYRRIYSTISSNPALGSSNRLGLLTKVISPLRRMIGLPRRRAKLLHRRQRLPKCRHSRKPREFTCEAKDVLCEQAHLASLCDGESKKTFPTPVSDGSDPDFFF
jgi:hypothetical protein